MEIHERIKKVRKSYSLTQSEFASKLGVSRSVISNLELNLLAKPEQKIPLIMLIAREFCISEKWLLEGKGSMLANDNNNSALSQAAALLSLDDEEKKFLAAYLKLKPEMRENVKAACRQLTKLYGAQDEISATLAIRPARSDEKVTREQAHQMIDMQFDAKEKGTTSLVSTATSGMAG